MSRILVIMYVKIFKTGIIVFISDVKMCLMSHWQIIFYISQFLHMWVTNWPNIFVDQCQFSDPDFISGTHQRKNVQFADKYASSFNLLKPHILCRRNGKIIYIKLKKKLKITLCLNLFIVFSYLSKNIFYAS
jgi:hypothetical protein